VTVKIFDALGRELMTLLDADVEAGTHSVYWDGRDARGWMVPSGTYFYQLIAGGIVQSKRMSFAR
jgi:flagellar hook assembly protein FlgD